MADLRQLVAEEAIRQGIDPNLAVALMLQESGGKANAVSKKGALGPMQLMPTTASGLGVDPLVPEENVRGGVTYLKQMLAKYGGDAKLALAAYNAGPGAVDQHGGIPPYPETQGYVRSVQARAARNPAAAFIKPQGSNQVAGNFFDQFDQQQPSAAPSVAPVPVGGNPFWRTTAGGVLRGLRDIPDAGAQLVTRGLETVAPAGSDFEAWARGERQKVEQINRDAEAEYQAGRATPRNVSDLIAPQNPGFDWSRMGGNIIGTLPVSALRAGGVVTSGALQGATAGALQPVYGSGENYWQDKGTQVGLGAVTGGVAGYAADRVGKLIQGARRANAPAPQPAPATAPNAAQVNTGGRIEPTLSGSGGGSTMGAVGPDPSAGLNEAQRRLLEVGGKLGFKTTPGQASGSRSLQQMEARLESSPFTSGPFNSIKSNNQTALNRIAARAIGVDGAGDVSEATLAQAADRIDKVYRAVADKKARAIDPNAAIDTLATLELDYEGRLSKPLLDHPLVSRYLQFATDGKATGEQLQTLSSKIGKAARGQMTSAMGDRELGMALFDVKEMVDDSLQQGLAPNLQAAFQGARGEYRNMMTLLQPGVVNSGSGNVSGLTLANKLAQSDKNGFRFGQNRSDLYEAARYAQAFKPIVGDSGTATRMPEISPLQWLLTLPTNVAAGAYTSRPVTAAARAAGTGLLPNSTGDAIAKYTRMFAPLTATQYEQGLLR